MVLNRSSELETHLTIPVQADKGSKNVQWSWLDDRRLISSKTSQTATTMSQPRSGQYAQVQRQDTCARHARIEEYVVDLKHFSLRESNVCTMQLQKREVTEFLL